MDKIGYKWIEMDQKMDQVGPKCTNVDWKGFKGTVVDRIRMNRQIRTKVDIMDQIGTNRTELDRIGPMSVE